MLLRAFWYLDRLCRYVVFCAELGYAATPGAEEKPEPAPGIPPPYVMCGTGLAYTCCDAVFGAARAYAATRCAVLSGGTMRLLCAVLRSRTVLAMCRGRVGGVTTAVFCQRHQLHFWCKLY